MNLPEDFIQYNKELMGDDLFDTLRQGLAAEPSVSVRVNPFKSRLLGLTDVRPVVASERVPWCKDAFYLNERPNFTFDPLLHGGLYYVQEASSMFLDTVLRQFVHEPVRMLDLCAAPGGKTTCAMAALPAGSKLWCNEPVRMRAQILHENILKFGHPDITVTNAWPKDYREAGMEFDVILTDVPCSGEGMFRKDAGAIAEWSPENVEKSWRLQREIVETIWPCLRPGGLLIYSTCTFNAHENEENVAWIAQELGAEFVEIKTEDSWGITGSLVDDNPVYRFLPGRTRGEGLFMAVLRKKSLSPCPSSIGKGGNNFASEVSKMDERWNGACGGNGDGRRTEEKNKAKKRKKDKQKGKGFDQSKHSAPLPMGDEQGERMQLCFQSLSLDCPFPTAALSWRDAVAYLQGQSIVLPPDTPKGYVAVTYKGLSIGLVKNLGNRANNLHPQPWRIRTTHIPEEETPIF